MLLKALIAKVFSTHGRFHDPAGDLLQKFGVTQISFQLSLESKGRLAVTIVIQYERVVDALNGNISGGAYEAESKNR